MLEQLGIQCGDLPKYAPEEDMELFYLAKSGDTRAKDKFILFHTRLIFKLLSKFANCTEDKQIDIFEAGVAGLMDAYEKFNPNNGAAFSTYSYKYIYSYMLREYGKQSTLVTIPNSVILSAGKQYIDDSDNYSNQNNVQINTAMQAANAIKPATYLDEEDDNGRSLHESLPSTYNLEDTMLAHIKSDELYAKLTNREKFILDERLLGARVHDIAKKLKVSRQTIYNCLSSIQKKAKVVF